MKTCVKIVHEKVHEKANEKTFERAKIWKFFIEMCLGLIKLHYNKILNRDIKTINKFLEQR